MDRFNKARKKAAASFLKVGNKSRSDIHLWNTAKGKLPQLSYIFHKNETLGKYFKAVWYVMFLGYLSSWRYIYKLKGCKT